MRLGLLIAGEPTGRLREAFDVMANLHAIFDAQPTALKGKSASHCVFSAQTAAAAFRKLGIEAKAAPCMMYAITRSASGGVDQHLIGSVDGKELPGQKSDGWNGHMVVQLDDYIFDPTFWQIDKNRMLPMMFALPRSTTPFQGMTAFARYRGNIGEAPYDILWIDTPMNTKFMKEKDERLERMRRDVVKTMISRTAYTTVTTS